MNKTTCGPLYFEGVKKYAGDNRASIRLFAAGFVSGEAEKVYLGACKAAMFRPSPEYQPMVQSIVFDVSRRYSLKVAALEPDEIWLLRDADAAQLFQNLKEVERDSPMWHWIRGTLCGVPVNEIDAQFHERKGYGERCDP